MSYLSRKFLSEICSIYIAKVSLAKARGCVHFVGLYIDFTLGIIVFLIKIVHNAATQPTQVQL
ncbi:hypothetical protein ANAPC5_00231 [Anaplasma phagocytophilum]|nr:hypothetical protein ANAPC2_00346 [Anaplasma phagocytophilum]SBO30915.1 hypothetical protein ANAPC3_00346 [Anaplasma phagocytophilum]SBO30982.1 hypothetical protein ANAPC4_00348 [Anaplasma phagocytophilum]SCV62362.1 hypothetical protein ANAPC5_00231 [Anaplasma phagocytophilum]